MPLIKANNINLFYESYGEGEPLILISGFASDHRRWFTVVEALAKRFRVIVFDNRGSGKSELTEEAYTTQLLSDDVVEMMGALGIPQAHVLGVSMGGAIAQKLALRYPDKVSRLILCSTFIKTPTVTRWVMSNTFRMLEHGVPIPLIAEYNLPWLYSNSFIDDPQKRTMALEQMVNNPHPMALVGYKNQIHACFEHDTHDLLHKITSPTLVMVGEEDLLTPVRIAQRIHESIPSASLTVTPLAGHLLHIEDPRGFVQSVSDFLTQRN